MAHPLRPVVNAWLAVIDRAMKHKKEHFQNDADEAMKFYHGPYDFIYHNKGAGGSQAFAFTGPMDHKGPSFRMTHNRAAELVQIYGPVLYHRNPERQVRPRNLPEVDADALGNPQDPEVIQQWMMINEEMNRLKGNDRMIAQIMQTYLNYTPGEYGLRNKSRRWIDEAILKGMGTMWPVLVRKPGSRITAVTSEYDTVDNLCIDPDMESLDLATWVARREVKPTWEWEREFGLPKDELKHAGTLESIRHQGASGENRHSDFNRKEGLTNDLMVCWRIYSKMGFGHRVLGASEVQGQLDRLNPFLEEFGEFTYLVVSENVPYPLNLPPRVWETESNDEIFMRAQWPIPLWADGRWPFVPLEFHPIPRQVWPMSHLKPGLGELTFLNWAYSFLAGKIRTTSRDFIAILQSAADDLRNSVLEGSDLTLLELQGSVHKNINEVVQFLQHPQVNNSLYDAIQLITQAFEKRMGLNEMMYGQQGKQIRSATAAQAQAQGIRIRPDDMAAAVDAASSELARAEAITARWALRGNDVAPIMGQAYGRAWDAVVASADMEKIIHEFEYRVEAGSARRKWTDETNLVQAVNNLAPVLLQVGQSSGDFSWLFNILRDFTEVLGLDKDRYLPLVNKPILEGGEEQDAAQQAQEQQEQKAQEHQQKLEFEAQTHEQQLQQDQEKHEQEMSFEQEDQWVERLGDLVQIGDQLARQEMMTGNGNGQG